jgi:hypothetical protein
MKLVYILTSTNDYGSNACSMDQGGPGTGRRGVRHMLRSALVMRRRDAAA